MHARALFAGGRRRLITLVTLAGALLTIVLAYQWFAEDLWHVTDDSLISMQYARRFATGDGLVFNPGERVEGYTNFLWTIAMSLVYWPSRLFHGDFVNWAVGLSIAVAALDIVLLVMLARRLWGDRVLPIAFMVALLALDNSYSVWAMEALESHFVALWVLATLLAWTSRHPRRAIFTGVCLAAVGMSRPDGTLFVAAFGLSEAIDVLVTLARRESVRAKFRQLSLAVGTFVLVFGIYFGARYAYYGWPLPNTFYLKVSSPGFSGLDRGTPYVRGFFEERGDLPFLALAALPWLGNSILRSLMIWMVVHLGYIAWVGGDFYAGHRFLVQLLPAFALLFGQIVVGIERALERPKIAVFVRRIGVRSALYALLVFFLCGISGEILLRGLKHGPLALEIRDWRHVKERNRQYMLWLRDRSQRSDWICIGDIGSGGIYADLRVIDYYGVIDPVVAHKQVPTLGRGKAGHEKTADVDYVLRRRPRFIKFGYLPGDFWSHGYYLDTQLPPEFWTAGIWIRDDLEERGTFSQANAVHFGPTFDPGWTATGIAFTTADRAGRGQSYPMGVVGWFVSSFHPELGDRATGELHSPPFVIDGDRWVLRVGGGHDPERLFVALVVDGQRVCSETGTNSDLLGRRECDISLYRGKTATIEMVDKTTAVWGHIVVDEIGIWASR